jgi:plastocyanin
MVMRIRILFISALLIVFAGVLSAKEVWLSIGGTTANGSFKTDARIFNPSTTKDIQIQAYYLPVGNVDNSAVQPLTPITVLKRQMVVYNDVVTSLFHSSGLGAIRLKSDDDFVATQRIYAVAANGSLGQFVGAVDASSAKTKGVIIQLAASGTFRTNVGAANPNASAAHVTWHLYDKNNAVVGTAFTVTMPPYAVIGPSGLAGYAAGGAGADLSDAWLSYTSDLPIVAYGSVIDNGTTDPTYIPASEDTGAAAVTTPAGKVFVVSEHGGTNTASGIDITPTITATTIKPGDVVTFQISARDSTHGFHLIDPDGNVLLDLTVAQDGAPIERTLTLNTQGTYVYYCTITTCSPGHLNMQGSFDVGKASTDPPKY